MKLNNKTAHKLRLLAINARHRGNDFDTFSSEEKWQTRAGQLDRAAELLSQAAKLIETALPDGDES